MKSNRIPFKFYTRLNLSELTGRKAANLSQFLTHLRQVLGASIYHHTHRFLQIHQYLSPEPPNDFAYWANEFLGEKELGEKLSSIDTIQFTSLAGLRKAIIAVVENHVKNYPLSLDKFVNPGEEFHFLQSRTFVVPTAHEAHNLEEFAEKLRRVSINCIYFHIFEARLRVGRKTNDFSRWLEASLGEKVLAGKIAVLDPYTRTMEDLRRTIINLIKETLGKK